MAIIRQVSSKTSEGLSTEIAKAYEDKLGFNEKGIEAEVGGIPESARLKLAWPHGRNERKQVFSFDLSGKLNQFIYTGVAAVGSIKSYTLTGTSLTSRSGLKITLNGVVTTHSLTSAARTATEIATIVEGVLDTSTYSSTIKTVSRSGAVVTIELFSSAGVVANLTVALEKYNTFTGVLTSTTALVSGVTVDRAHVSATPSREIQTYSSLEVEQSGTSLPADARNVTTVPGGSAGLTLARLKEIILSAATTAEFSLSFSGDTLVATINSGFSGGGFELVLNRKDIDNTNFIEEEFVGSITTSHLFATAEAHGTLFFTIKKPGVAGQSYTVSVEIPENQSVLQLETLIKDSILNHVIDSVAGTTLSSFVSVATTTLPQTTVGSITFENFEISLDWGIGGRISSTVPVTSDFIDESSLAGQTGATVSYEGTIDINLIAEGSSYTIISFGDATQILLRDISGEPTRTFVVGDRFTASAAGSTFADLTTTVNQFVGGDNTSVTWDSFSTSSVLQPGGDTTHFATLIKV